MLTKEIHQKNVIFVSIGIFQVKALHMKNSTILLIF